MIGAIRASFDSEQAFLTGFRRQFPDTHERRLGALLLIPVDGHPQIEMTYPTRSVLAAHWADRDQDLDERAKKLYSLHPTLTRHVGQTVLSISGASLSEITNNQSIPPYGYTIEVGKVPTDPSISYGFKRTSYLDLPVDIDDARCLDYAVSMELDHVATISVDPEFGVSISDSPRSDLSVMAMSGRVSLENDPELYFRIRQDTNFNTVVFGTDASADVLTNFTPNTDMDTQLQIKELLAS